MQWTQAHENAFLEGLAKVASGDLDRDLIETLARNNAEDAADPDAAVACAIETARQYATGELDMPW